MRRALLILLLAWPLWGQGAEFDYALQPQQVAPDVYVFVGKTEDFDTHNGGNIVNTGFVIASEGVIVIDTGPSLRYGQQMRAAITRVTGKPVVRVINTHHHPDHFLGNQAFADVPILALSGTRQGILNEGNAFAENLYRMSGDWMKGTEVLAPTETVAAGTQVIAGRHFQFWSLDGHTGADLVLMDRLSGVLFVGDLAFNGRAPTTPHADVGHWLAALDQLEHLSKGAAFSALVPGHGAVTHDDSPLRRTRAWLQWLVSSLQEAARAGLDMNEVLRRPLPAAFADLPVAPSEYSRSVGHLFPAFEQDVLEGRQ